MPLSRGERDREVRGSMTSGWKHSKWWRQVESQLTSGFDQWFRREEERWVLQHGGDLTWCADTFLLHMLLLSVGVHSWLLLLLFCYSVTHSKLCETIWPVSQSRTLNKYVCTNRHTHTHTFADTQSSHHFIATEIICLNNRSFIAQELVCLLQRCCRDSAFLTFQKPAVIVGVLLDSMQMLIYNTDKRVIIFKHRLSQANAFWFQKTYD